MFRQEIRNGYQVEQPDNWLLHPDPWEVARTTETRGSAAQLLVPARRRDDQARSPASPSTCWVCRTIVRSSATAARRSTPCGSGPRHRPTSSISASSPAASSSARCSTRSWPSRSPGCSIPTIRRRGAGRSGSCRSTSWSPARWATSSAGSGGAAMPGGLCPTRWRSSSTTRTRRWLSPS